MTNTHKTETIAKALVAAMLRLGIGTAVFEQRDIFPYRVRFRNQSDGSIAVILEEPSSTAKPTGVVQE